VYTASGTSGTNGTKDQDQCSEEKPVPHVPVVPDRKYTDETSDKNIDEIDLSTPSVYTASGTSGTNGTKDQDQCSEEKPVPHVPVVPDRKYTDVTLFDWINLHQTPKLPAPSEYKNFVTSGCCVCIGCDERPIKTAGGLFPLCQQHLREYTALYEKEHQEAGQ